MSDGCVLSGRYAAGDWALIADRIMDVMVLSLVTVGSERKAPELPPERVRGPVVDQ